MYEYRRKNELKYLVHVTGSDMNIGEYWRKNELKYLVHVTASDMNIGEYWQKNELKFLVLALGFMKKKHENW